MLLELLRQPGVQDLPGGFQEVAFYRNENNTGPIIRLYAVSVRDASPEQLQQYGNFMPHTKYGTTRVYFFKEGSPVPPALYPGDVNVDAAYQPYCIAMYEKSSMGQVSLVFEPF
ncbi:hypothetical protein ADICEAN_01529 [Cesiribacter andamanensis AMV16]|uniref:Uncharacterized protein n=2 Tax=Cesiribacter TaxID=1133570 RepID=M7N819_9BACT|nr:hypothetical protein ADICEAN_01529 [Cesiribacter andamanensis AMV16]